MMFQAGPWGLSVHLEPSRSLSLPSFFIFSVISWAIILYKWRMFRASEREDQRSCKPTPVRRRKTICGATPSATPPVQVQPSFSASWIGYAGTEGIPATALSPPELDAPDRQYLDRVIAHIMQDQLSRQEAYLPFLATTGNISPFIGLLGTVLGIIDSFRKIGKQGTASIAAVAPGVSEVFVATAAGFAARRFPQSSPRTTISLVSVNRPSGWKLFSIELPNTVLARMKQVGTADHF